MRMEYPVVNTERGDFTKEEQALIQQILRTDGRLRASKPKNATGEAKYLWRIVAFAISPNPTHHCMPVMADVDLMYVVDAYESPLDLNDDSAWRKRYDKRRALAQKLDDLATRVEQLVPVEQRYGTMRWAAVL